MDRIVIRVLLSLVLVATLAGCASSSTNAKATAPDSPFAGTYLAVCQAARDARKGNTNQARTVFVDRAHQGVHALATKASQGDRPAAGRLLERKERVEDDLAGTTTAKQLADDLDALAETARTAIAATGAPRPQTCEETLR